MDRISRMATIAAQKCLKSSGMVVRQGNAYEIGLISGTSTGHLGAVSDFYNDFTAKGAAYADAGLFPNTVVNAHAGYITIQLRIKGYTTVVTQGNASGAIALELAARALRAGTCSMMLAGSTAEYSRNYHRALIDTGLANDRFIPYGEDSLGNVIGEGAVFFALERLSSAKERGAEILGVLRGVDVGYVPALPSTFRFSGNPLRPLLSKLTGELRPSSVIGDGNGYPMASSIERKAIEETLSGVPLKTFADMFGYATGVNALNSMALACLVRKFAKDGHPEGSDETVARVRDLSELIGSNPVCTLVSEGGAAAAISLGLE